MDILRTVYRNPFALLPVRVFHLIVLGSVEDYKMLEKINKVTAAKYADVRSLVSGVNHSMQDLNSKCKYLYVKVGRFSRHICKSFILLVQLFRLFIRKRFCIFGKHNFIVFKVFIKQ